MQTRIRALGHPVHQMLVVFPLGLFITGTIFDLIHLISDNGTFAEVGFWMISAGVIGAVLAALTGFADWTSVPSGTRAKRVGALHGTLNAIVLVLFAICWLVRVNNVNHAPRGGGRLHARGDRGRARRRRRLAGWRARQPARHRRA